MNKATLRGLKLIQLITPTTPRDRAVEIARLDHRASSTTSPWPASRESGRACRPT